jgi:TPR repeat protein
MSKGVKLLQEAIKENDDPKPMAFLSLAYHKGYGVEQNDKKALELLEQSSNHKDWFPRARMQLGIFYALGIGVEKDFTTAQYWIENSMKSPEDKQIAMACMAYMYDPSTNIYPNPVKYKHWLTLLKKNKGNYDTLKEKLITYKYFD